MRVIQLYLNINLTFITWQPVKGAKGIQSQVCFSRAVFTTKFNIAFITLDRPQTLHIGLKMVFFCYFEVLCPIIIMGRKQSHTKGKAYNTSACKNSHAYTSVTDVTTMIFGTQLPALLFLRLLKLSPMRNFHQIE